MKKGFRQKAILECLQSQKSPLSHQDLFLEMGASATAKKEIKRRVKKMVERGYVRINKNGKIVFIKSPHEDHQDPLPHKNKSDHKPRDPGPLASKKDIKGKKSAEPATPIKWFRPREKDKQSDPSSQLGRFSLKRGRPHVLLKKRGTLKPYPLITDRAQKLTEGDLLSVVPAGKGSKSYSVVARVGEGVPFPRMIRDFYREFKIRDGYPKAGLKEAEKLDLTSGPNHKGRIDCTDQYVITIDPEGARDHDDALCVRPLDKKGWELFVHIADVSEYVEFNSILDNYAKKRAFTQYFPWGAIPMLPEKLSNDLCSLREGEKRKALTCKMQIGSQGKITGFEFFESWVCVNRFWTYEQAFEECEKGDPHLKELEKLADALTRCRSENGILLFNLPEPRFTQGEDGAPVSMSPRKSLPSNNWIEECMLAANRCTAQFITQSKLPGIHRIHEPPDLTEGQEIIHLLTLVEPYAKKPFPASAKKLPANITDVRNLYRRILEVKGISENAALLSFVQSKLLRTMKKAMYATKGVGHFALGWKHYAHFTSPIRRYPDLWNHRLIKWRLHHKKIPGAWKANLREFLEPVNEREIDVMKLERRSHKCALAWIMRDSVGEIFQARICHLDAKGVAVFLQTSLVFGEIWNPLSRLAKDYYDYQEDAEKLVGRRTGHTIKLNEEVKIRIQRVNPAQAEIDFDLMT